MSLTEEQYEEVLKRRGVVGVVAIAPCADIVLDLPPPISVNRIWRKTKAGVIKSAAYESWIRRADTMLLELRQIKGVKPIVGKFDALIVVKRSNLDLDNNSKCVLDFLQNRNFIVNDKFCEELILRWGDAPTGCRVTVRARCG